MGKLICIAGKSAAGKDTLFRLIRNSPFLKIKTVIPYTTRPKRINEKDGDAYRFVSAEEMDRLEKAGEILEKRTYHTTKGDWHYFTPKIRLDGREHRIMITTPEAFGNIAENTDKEQLVIVLLEADEKERFRRSFERESKQPEPNYKEIFRRYIADENDFKDADFSDTHRQFVINADKSALRCYIGFHAVLRAIKNNKAIKLNTNPMYRNQTEVLEKCKVVLNKIEKGEKITEDEIRRVFKL